MVRAPGCQCQSRNSPGFDHSIFLYTEKSDGRQMKQCRISYEKTTTKRLSTLQLYILFCLAWLCTAGYCLTVYRIDASNHFSSASTQSFSFYKLVRNSLFLFAICFVILKTLFFFFCIFCGTDDLSILLLSVRQKISALFRVVWISNTFSPFRILIFFVIPGRLLIYVKTSLTMVTVRMRF